MRTDIWVSRGVDFPWERSGRQAQPTARPTARPLQTWHRLRDQADVAYLCFAKLRRSDADQDELAADAAWSCWRLRRLVRVSTRSTTASVAMRLRLRATWLALGARWGARPCHDIATAHLVVASMRELLAGVDGYMMHLTNSCELEAMSRRRAELAEVLERAELVEARLQDARAPLWENFIPRRGCS